MSYFMQSGDNFSPTPGRESLLDTLPVGNFVVSHSQMNGFFLKKSPKFDVPAKMYGDASTRADRILNTFLDRPRATGVLFAGEKGSGKSQLARLISYKGYEMGLPTLLVNQPWVGDGFSNLLADVEQPAIILMDEFEKVYNDTDQEGVLTLLDGSMTSKKLFVLTVNNKWKVSEHMKNRPGRLYYALDFAGLEAKFIREYCEDNLDIQEHVDAVVTVSSIFESFNFDMLKALVEEMNRYHEDPYEALTMLNAKPLPDYSSKKYKVIVWKPNGKEIQIDEIFSDTPLSVRGGRLGIFWNNASDNDDDEDSEGFESLDLIVSGSDARKVNSEKGLYEFELEDGHRVRFTRQEVQSYDLRSVGAF